MTARPRQGRGDDATGPEDLGPALRPAGAGSISRQQDEVGRVVRAGKAGAGLSDSVPGTEASPPAVHPDDAQLGQALRVYEQLGDETPEFNIAGNDRNFAGNNAHTVDRHGPDLPLRRDPAAKTVEGRIYGDEGWGRPENWSLRWTDHTTMHREINNYVRENWEKIRNGLALEGTYSGAFDAGHRVGEGFYNEGMHGAGPRQSRYTAASLVRITIDLVPGADPPQPFIVTAFPAGVLPPGLI